jgi:hypothetical protein
MRWVEAGAARAAGLRVSVKPPVSERSSMWVKLSVSVK